jgi:hypothetical protein
MLTFTLTMLTFTLAMLTFTLAMLTFTLAMLTFTTPIPSRVGQRDGAPTLEFALQHAFLPLKEVADVRVRLLASGRVSIAIGNVTGAGKPSLSVAIPCHQTEVCAVLVSQSS